MTNLTVSEKLALEEVFECLESAHYRKSFIKKRLWAYRMMRLMVTTRRKLLQVKR